MTDRDGTQSPGKPPVRKQDMPATVGLVWEVRDELKADIRSLDCRFDGLEARMVHLEARMDRLEGRFDAFEAKMDAKFNAFTEQMDAKFNAFTVEITTKLDSALLSMQSIFHNMQAINEQQRSENRIVLESLSGLHTRQDRVEQRQDEMDKFLAQIAKTKPKH